MPRGAKLAHDAHEKLRKAFGSAALALHQDGARRLALFERRAKELLEGLGG